MADWRPIAIAEGPPLPSWMNIQWPWSRRAPSKALTPRAPVLENQPVPEYITNQPVYEIGDIIKYGGQTYTVHGADAYNMAYLLGYGSFPQDVLMNYWVPSADIDRQAIYQCHVNMNPPNEM